MPEAAGLSIGASRCAGCGTQLAPTLLICPMCGSLARGTEADRLEAEADALAASGEVRTALERRREALALLPAGSPRHDSAVARIAELTRAAGATPATGPGDAGLRRWWGLGLAAGLFLLTKGKLLLVGLTKLPTLLTMLAFIGVYWQRWGWAYAVGFGLSIYIHEMGHVAALARYGIRASAPMFVPGFGAFVRLNQHPASVHEDARIGLAGPIWGLGAALVAHGAYLATGIGTWGAIAHTGAVINLFNLLPVWQLDGGRAFRALARPERAIAALGIGAAWLLSRGSQSSVILVLLLIVAVVQAFRDGPEEGDNGALGTYLGLVGALTWLAVVAPPTR